ncbi:MAG: gamma-glutamylcyclotransferase [Rhizonema sp. PD37]|nr:gamma-glutamylcyclotransferase [Rhizonema sp. PD37]
MSLTRTDLESKLLHNMILQSGLGLKVLSEEELQASIDLILRRQKLDSDIWLFAYGSLIWNPIFRFIDRRVGTVYGWHRRFCLWAPVGRGTPDNPGLVLGLERGGSCRGIVYQIAAADVLSELLLLWRREMVDACYVPRWVKVSDGTQQIEAIAFVINRLHPNYAQNLSLDTTVNSIASASGQLGSCADYLIQTVNALTMAGIKDKHLLLLRDQVVGRKSL